MLYYAADPMCSWCWGFAPVLAELRERLTGVPVRHVMGGLAPDSNDPMEPAVRAYVQQAWRSVASVTGAKFNWDFWERCEPRRSTYAACRAVLAAEQQQPGAGERVFRAIQRAYYQEARNPSDVDTLVAVAAEQGLNAARFEDDLDAPETHAALEADQEKCRSLQVGGFPTLLWVEGGQSVLLCRGHATLEELLERVRSVRGASPKG